MPDLSESALWLAERQPTGFLVALWLDDDTASQLAVAGGESADALHVTLCYCGDAAELGDLATMRGVAAVERDVRWRSPLEGKIAGYGRFIASDTSDGQDVFYASVDIPGLVELRQCVASALMEAGCPPSMVHGYTPHVTLAYVATDAANPVDQVPPLPLKFEAVTVMIGGKRVDIPFAPVESGYATPISMSEEAADVPLTAPLGVLPARPLLFSFDQKWIPFLPIPGRYAHTLYGTLDLTAEKYDRIVANFRANVYGQDLPVNCEHDSRAAGAVGWIRDMRIAADGSIEVKPEWNDRGTALIEGDRFRYVSAEFCDRWQDPVTGTWHQDVAVGLAICTRPHFKTDVLHPLAASEGAALALAHPPITAGATGTEEPVMPDEPTTVQPPAPAATAATASAQLSDLSLTDVVITAAQRQQERQQFADLTARVELAERRATTAEAERDRLLRERRTERFTAEVLGRSAENNLAWLGSIEENVGHLVSLAEKHGDDSAEVRWAITQKRNERRAVQASGLFDPISVGARGPQGDVVDRVAHLAEQRRQVNPTLSKEQAIAQVYSENPDLYLQYLDGGRR